MRLYFLLSSQLDLSSLLDCSLVLSHILGLVLLRRYKVLHGLNEGDGHSAILFVFGLVSVTHDLFEQLSVKLCTFSFGTLDRGFKLLHLFVELLIVAHHFLVFLGLMQLTSEIKRLQHCVKVSCWVFAEILQILL